MKEIMRKFAHEIHPLEFESMSVVPFSDLIAEAYKHSRYASKNGKVVAANREGILDADGVESAIIRALREDGEFVDRKDGKIYAMRLASVQTKLSNRFWMNKHAIESIRADIDAVAESIAKTAAKAEDDKNIEKDTVTKGDEIKLPCRNCKKYMEDRTTEGGKVWCKLWNTPIENVRQLDGTDKYNSTCVPTKILSQGQPDSGTNQWGNETPRDLSQEKEKK